MKLQINTVILGAGYAGLIVQDTLRKLGQKSIIIERGYSHGNRGSDYVVFTKNEFTFTDKPINVFTKNLSSGAAPFEQEYVEKVYNQKIDLSLFAGGEDETTSTGYTISGGNLLSDANIYGNVSVTRIDIDKKKIYGKVLHLNEDAEISYTRLINTVPIHRFAKLCGVNLFDGFGVFVSYFPIGINRTIANDVEEDMNIEYYGDPNIPYYRKQHHGRTIFYEYCLNKPFNVKFDSVVSPGKFVKIKKEYMDGFLSHYISHGVFFAGRYALWDPDFLLDDLVPTKLGGRNNEYQEYFDEFYLEGTR